MLGAITKSNAPCNHYLHLAMEPRHRNFELTISKSTSARPLSVLLDSLHDDPRYKAFLKKMNLPE